MYLFYNRFANLHLEARLNGLYTAADTVNLWAPDDERISRSKHVKKVLP